MPEETKWLVTEKDEWDTAIESVMTGMVIALMVMVIIPMLPVVQQAQQYFAGQYYQGNVETRILHATEALKYWDLINDSPYRPLISAFFINRGLNTVFVAINEAKDWMEIRPDETRTVSHVGADKRIEIIFYKCNIGETASVEAEGHY